QEKYLEDSEIELFNSNVLEQLSLSHTEGLLVRPLKSGDYDRGFLQLLTQLTEVGDISREQFLNRFHMMRNSGSYYTIVIEDISTEKIISSATLVVEQKFIHNCALRGRLEDVVVNNKYRGKHLGKLVVKIISELSYYLRCYKLSLDCKDHLIPFYESLGFKREPSNANYLNKRFSIENTAEQFHL
ncbi:putative glucosamine 6-phosphate N-acetyltransferase, partial [Eufriesea mexicana]